MQTHVTDFLLNFGLLPANPRPDNTGNIRIACIDECAEQGKNQKHNLSINTVTGQFQCFRCGFAGPFNKLQRRYEPPSPEELALQATQLLFSSHLGTVLESLKARGFEEPFLKEKGLGYAPNGYSKTLQAQHHVETLVSLGLVSKIKDESGAEKYVEPLADRITIPYYHADGQLYAWKARLRMDDTSTRPKYVAPAGATFSPYNERALNKHNGEVIACEGELDALTLIQHGFNAVGLPTGAQSFHHEWFKNVTPTFVYDNDEAGHKGLEKAVKAIGDCKALWLPEGTDVNGFVAELGIGAFKSLLSSAIPYVDGKLEESDHLGHRLAAFDDWAYSNGVMVGAETGFPGLTEALDGWPQQGLVVVLAGSNVGKSSFMVQSSDQAIENNEDLAVGYASLDDSERTTFAKLVAYKANLTYPQVVKPRSELANSTELWKNLPELLKRRKQALSRLSTLADRLIVRDVRFGRSLTSFERWVRRLRRTFADKRLIFFVDSFDKMTLSADAVQNTDSKGGLIQELKRVTTEQNCLIVTSAEIRKIGDKRPTISDIKDTTQVEYECDVAISLYQAYHHDQDTPLVFKDENGRDQPIIELWVLKNKVSSFKGGPLLYYFESDKSRLQEVPADQIAHYKKLVKEDMTKGKGSKKSE